MTRVSEKLRLTRNSEHGSCRQTQGTLSHSGGGLNIEPAWYRQKGCLCKDHLGEIDGHYSHQLAYEGVRQPRDQMLLGKGAKKEATAIWIYSCTPCSSTAVSSRGGAPASPAFTSRHLHSLAWSLKLSGGQTKSRNQHQKMILVESLSTLAKKKIDVSKKAHLARCFRLRAIP